MHTSFSLRAASLAALLWGSAAAAQAQSSVTMYGTLDVGLQTRNHSVTDMGRQTEVMNGGIRPSIFGFRGTEDLGGGLKSFFNLEGQFSTDTGGLVSGPGSTQLFRRQANVGLQGGWGTLTLGRQYSPALIGTLATEPRTFKEQFSNLYLWAYNQLSAPGNAMNAGTNNSNDVGVFVGNALQYSLSSGPLYFGVSYSLGEQAGSAKKGRELSLGASYTGPVTLGLGYQSNRDTVSAVELSKLYSVGAAVPFGDFTARVNYMNVKNHNPVGGAQVSKVDGLGVGLDFKWSASDTATLALYHNKYQGTDSHSKTKALVLSNDHALSKRTTLYAQLAFVDAAAVGVADPLENLKGSIVAGGTAPNRKTTLLGVGINHNF